MTKKNYKVVDTYDGYDLLGYADTREEANKLAEEQVEATDGECYIVIRKLEEDGKYHIVKD